MKNKHIILGALLFLGSFASAQINTQSQPSASINQENPFLDASGYMRSPNNIGKGLYFPKTDLTTWEFKTNLIDPGTFSTYFDGMIVYNSGTGNTIADATKGGKQVAVTPGFYYFKNPNQTAPTGSVANGEWVRLGDDYTQLWAQRTNNGITETYLKPADANNEAYVYSPKRNYINLGNHTEQEIVHSTGFKLNNFRDVPNLLMISSRALPNGVNTNRGMQPYFSKNIFTIGRDHNNTQSARYTGHHTYMNANNLDYNVTGMIGNLTETTVLSSSKVSEVVSGRNTASIGNNEGTYNPTIDVLIASQNIVDLYSGKATTAYGSVSNINIKSNTNVSNIIGSGINIGSASNKEHTEIIGANISIYHNDNQITDRLFGNKIYTYHGKTSEVKTKSVGILSEAKFKDGSNVNEYVGVGVNISADGTSLLENAYGFKFTHDIYGFTPKNMYGIHIQDIISGTETNYAIHTGRGKVRIGDFAKSGAGDRIVYADENGILKTSGSITSNNGIQNETTMECNDANRGKMNFVKDVTLAGGSKADAFAVCLKGSDGNHYWRYLYGAGGETTGAGNFGTGLQ